MVTDEVDTALEVLDTICNSVVRRDECACIVCLIPRNFAPCIILIIIFKIKNCGFFLTVTSCRWRAYI